MARGILRNKYVRDLWTFPAAACEAWRHQGWVGVRRELAVRTTRRVVEWGRAVVLEHELDSLREIPPPDDLRLAPYRPEDDPAIAAVSSRATARRLLRLHERGRVGMVAWRGSSPVGWGWLSWRMDPDLETYPMPLPEGAVYGWDLHVVPDERGRGIGRALIVGRARLARERGAHRLRVVIERTNTAPLRLAGSLFARSRAVGEIRYFRLLGRTRARFVPEGEDR